MPLSRIAAVLLVGSAVGCIAPQPKTSDEMQLDPSKAGDETQLTLPESDFVDSEVRKFIASPSAVPDPRSVTLEEVNGEIQFGVKPNDWIRTKQIYPTVWVLVHDEGKFRTTISIAQKVLTSEQDALPADALKVRCCTPKQRSKNTEYIDVCECRVVRTYYGFVEIKFEMHTGVASPEAQEECLALVRRHYGKYLGVCESVRHIVGKNS